MAHGHCQALSYVRTARTKCHAARIEDVLLLLLRIYLTLFTIFFELSSVWTVSLDLFDFGTGFC